MSKSKAIKHLTALRGELSFLDKVTSKIETLPADTLPTEGTWIRFMHQPTLSPSSKTTLWEVVSKPNPRIEVLLGSIKWFGRWRKYAFFPNTGVDPVFEEVCLTEIADFCRLATKLHRQAKKMLGKRPIK